MTDPPAVASPDTSVTTSGGARPAMTPDGSQGSTETLPPPVDKPGSSEEEAGDTCGERRVSYTKPCSKDPDPCNLKSGWVGDEYCLLPPPADKGIQIHIGPENYTDEAEVAKYIIQAGEEFNDSVAAPIPLTGTKWWNRITVQMRPGSHHWISSVLRGQLEKKFYSGTTCGGGSRIGDLGGGQNLIYDNPPGGIPAPENVGLGRSLEGDSSLCMNLHAYNFNDKPQLREMWINIYFVEEKDVTQRASPVALVGGTGLNLAPGENKEAAYEYEVRGSGRIIQLFGHRHVWTPRFAVWLNDRLVYESWSWQESVTYNYDSLTTNPPINSAMKVDGAVSGMLPVEAGDKLKFTCFIENTSDKTLRFTNELYDGEMCNLWGSAVGTTLAGFYR